jgi:hypothetical protein
MAKTEEVQIYKVHSGVRKVHTRMKRMKAAGRHRFVQRLAGGDITVRRVRAATITETQLKAHLPELQRAHEEGRIEVRTVTGELVDLKTMKVAAKPASPPKPAPPLDSAANDKTFPEGVGQKMPMYEGGPALDDNPEPPPTPVLPGDDSSAGAVTAGDPVAERKKERKKRE